jgi:hypothetical protein
MLQVHGDESEQPCDQCGAVPEPIKLHGGKTLWMPQHCWDCAERKPTWPHHLDR